MINDSIVLRIPGSTRVGSLRALADDIGCDVRLLADGSYLFVERPHHGNSSIVQMQRYRGQLKRLNGRDLPQPPNGDAA